MDGFVAPVFHVWYHQNSLLSTPDNGILYCSRYDVSYIPPQDSNHLPKISIMAVSGFIKSLACSPDWTDKRLFATLDEYNILHVWDLDLQQPVKGHRAHATGTQIKTSKKQLSDVTAAICFTTDGKVISCVHSDLVVYCLLTDRYKVTPDFFRNKTVVTLEPSPVDRDIFIAGLKDGLIQIFSIKKMTILHTLRGHDKEIVSIACMNVPVLKKNAKRQQIEDCKENVTGSASKSVSNRPKKQARKKTVPIADEPDCFDIYDFNESLEEFGTIIDRETMDDKRDQFREKAKTVEGFNFLEACENLKEDIIKAANRRDEDEEEDDIGEQSGIVPEEFNTDDENELDDCEKLRDYVVVDNEEQGVDEEADEEQDELEYKLILVSGSRENMIWFWDYETGLPIDKITVPSIANARLCDTSFTNAVWIDESHVVANNSNGQVIEWKVEFKFKNERLHLSAKESLAPYPVDKIFHVIRAKGLAKTDTNGRYLWCSSINRKLTCLEVAESGKASIIVDYGCITPTNRCLVENPLESMVIALASGAPRIEKLNLARLQNDNIPFKSFTNKISGAVMQLCWHPEEEEKLAFGTKEGRIGIFDTSSSSNVPVLLKPFTNREVYGLQWCFLTDDKQEKRLVLLACSKVELVYYHMSGAQKHEPIKCVQFGHVSEVTVVGNLCFIGTQHGTIYVSDLDNNFKLLYHKKIAKRYICGLEFKNNYLAVGSNDHSIRVINFSDGFDGEAEKEQVLLEGHTDGICKVRWNRGDTMRLVSCSFDCTIRIWDTSSATCLKIYHTRSFAYAAIFSPLDENIILFVGKGNSLSSFDYTKQHDEPPKGSTKYPKIVFAVEDGVKPIDSKQKKKKAARDLKKSRKAYDGDHAANAVDQLTEGLNKVTMQEANAVQASANLSTTFQLTNRETNKTKDVLECIVKLLHTPDPEPEPEPHDYYNDGNSSDNDFLDDKFNDLSTRKPAEATKSNVEPAANNGETKTEQEKMFYNEKLFSTPEHLKQLIEEESKLHTITDTSSIGLVMLPQLLHKLKETILGCISKKKLTPQMLALAPYVSHMFWRQCCQAYAYQLIESHQSLAAVPFFLASHKADSSIEELCDAKYYREAWVICRLNKTPDDPMLEQVANKWAHHLNDIGNYEAAALVWTGIKKYKEAIDVLTKRRDITEDIQHTIDELNVKLQEATSVMQK
ncbi:protein rigor mortis isoform X2 [Anopheles funestus]|uniref:protein rigor mortis isoform X2 n=1 Tax=Anopheles funestus TaxID=62324 RepID=UPI0020C65211|nr:protein rigor mortis isoform X2 [Anopheles funestus]